MVLQHDVQLRAGGRDRAGAVVGTVLLDGVDVGRRMVEEGNAWSARVKWDHGPFVKQERMARSLGRGLHGSGGAMRPSEWRRVNGPCP
jgi:endonuclease YncB( thermonuclease family)